MELHFQWKQQTGRYSNGTDLFLNRINMGYVVYNSTMSRDLPQAEKDSMQYLGSSYLYHDKRWYGKTEEEVKKIIEVKITTWFIEALK